jgi:3-methylcrotonyl-CoA carboxylase beta subunit
VADHYADNDIHAIQICRNIFETFPVPQRQQLEIKKAVEPVYDPSEIYGLLPENPKESIDPYEIIMRIVDGSRFHEFKARYGTTIVTGFAHIMGFPVGIIANNGILFSESALKATHFIELCNFRKIPMIFLQNITGFIVGKEFEHRGIARDGAKMVQAVASSVVPKFTIITGGSFGAGNYAMSGRAYDPRFLFMWPNSRISVMGGEQAADVLVRVKEDQSGRSTSKDDLQKMRDEILKKYEYEGSAYYSSSRLWDDGIIDPADTRKVLAMAISVSLNKKFPEPKTGIYRM